MKRYGHTVHSLKDTSLILPSSGKWKTCAFRGLTSDILPCYMQRWQNIARDSCTQSYHQRVKAAFPHLKQPQLLILNQISSTGQDSYSWTSLERSLSGTANNKYSSENSRELILGFMFHNQRGNSEFHTGVRLLQYETLNIGFSEIG